MIEIKTVDDIHNQCGMVIGNCEECEISKLRLACKNDSVKSCWFGTNGPTTLLNIIAYNRKEKLRKLLS